MLFLNRANSLEDIQRAAKRGWGIKVDVRTHRQEPHLSELPMVGWDDFLDVEQLGRLIVRHKLPCILELCETKIAKITAEALGKDALILCKAIGLTAPEQGMAGKVGLKTLCRLSMYESIEMPSAVGYWLDFYPGLTEIGAILQERPVQVNTYLASPELNGKVLTESFARVALAYNFAGICTDYPERYDQWWAPTQGDT